MDSSHEKLVAKNREYLRIIIDTLMFTAQQNIPQRGNEENRSNLDSISDINRGNFLELLHLRCEDNTWFAEMLNNKLASHSKWTSSSIQTELIQILSDFVLERILDGVRASGVFAVIMDETSDISRTEQVSLCLSYVVGDMRKEAFVGFFKVKSTEGHDYQNEISKTVAECFDGAANMSGVHKGLATLMKEMSPMSIYIYIYIYPLLWSSYQSCHTGHNGKCDAITKCLGYDSRVV